MTTSTATGRVDLSDQHFAGQLRLALASAEIGDWSWDADSNLVNLSPLAAELFGVAPQTEIPRPELRGMLHESDREITHLKVEEAIRRREKFHVEFRIARPNEAERWLSMKGCAVYDRHGEVVGMAGVVYDVTATKVQQQKQEHLAIELQNHVAEWQSLFDTAPIAIWIAHDPQCKLVTANRYTTSVLGVPEGSNISLTSTATSKINLEILQNGQPVTPDELPLRIACFKGIPVQNCEQEIRTPEGRRFSVLVNAVPLYDEKGAVRGALATGLDITERKKNESALRESEQRFRFMADASPSLIWIIGPDTLYSWVNKAWLNFVGKPLESQLGRGWTENVHPDDFQKCLDTYQKAFESRTEFELEYRLKRLDGEYRWLLAKGRPLFEPEEKFSGFIGSCVDVTENKVRREELENLVLERTAQMKESIAQLEAFSYTVSHDMRAPLRSMEGFSQALLEDYGDRLDNTGKDYLHRVINSAQKLDLLIAHVLSYSRIATGRIPLADANLAEVIGEVIAEHDELNLENVSLSINLNCITVKANPGMLRQIFTHLLLNGCKFVAPGTKPNIRIRSDKIGSIVKVTVEDNGIGIAPEYQSKIFEVFSKLHTEREFKGTGIGLAIVKKAVQMLGGEIGVESEPGRGSCFWFTLKH